MPYVLDQADIKLIGAMRSRPRATVTHLASKTGMARATVQSRLGRLEAEGVIIGYGPELAAAASGFGVMAFTTLSIVQGKHDDVVRMLGELPEVLEVHVVTGSGDLVCRVAARSNDHLHDLLQQIVTMPGVGRVDSQLALSTPVSRTLADLVAGNSHP